MQLHLKLIYLGEKRLYLLVLAKRGRDRFNSRLVVIRLDHVVVLGGKALVGPVVYCLQWCAAKHGLVAVWIFDHLAGRHLFFLP